MKDMFQLQFLLKFGPKTWKFLVTCTCPNFLCCQKMHFDPLGVNVALVKMTYAIAGQGIKWHYWCHYNALQWQSCVLTIFYLTQMKWNFIARNKTKPLAISVLEETQTILTTFQYQSKLGSKSCSFLVLPLELM